MYEFTFQQQLFYLAVWVLAFLSAAARSGTNDSGFNIWHILAFSSTAGFLGFGCVTFLVSWSTFGTDSGWPYLGVAALVGFLGKEQDTFAKWLLKKATITNRILNTLTAESIEKEGTKND